jgi:AraC family transcriptional regulator
MTSAPPLARNAAAADVLQTQYRPGRGVIVGNIAADLQQALAQRALEGAAGRMLARPLAGGDGWTVADVLCTHGPRDHHRNAHAAVLLFEWMVAGTFGYRCAAGDALLTPGALMLGNIGACFECGHRHAAGDRCLAFHYAPAYFERLAADAGVAAGTLAFRHARIPPLRSLTPLIARACTDVARTNQMSRPSDSAWNELAVELATTTVQAAGALTQPTRAESAAAWLRVAKAVHLIDEAPQDEHTLGSLARAAGLSEFHFLRTFQRVTGVTPHQYLLRARLRAAALQVAGDTAKIVDIALACGFNDLSNFNHAFRQEFDVSPRAWRSRSRGVFRARVRAHTA